MTSQQRSAGRVLRNIRHGGQILPDDAPDAEPTTDKLEEVSLLSSVVADRSLEGQRLAEVSTPFNYLFDDLAAQFPAQHLPGEPAAVTAALKKLGEALAEPAPPRGEELQTTGNSTIPAVYTYWGQFIDHDITANTDRQNSVTDLTAEDLTPLEPEVVRRDLRNLREPALNLDSVYGDGPTFEGGPETAAADMYDGIALRLSEVAEGEGIPGEHIPTLGDNLRDLPRDSEQELPEDKAVALIGDGRNDENLIVAQFHVAFLRFHNAVLEWARYNAGYPQDDQELFDRVRNLVRWHYQWLVVHDYLKTVTLPGIVDKVLLGGNKHYQPRYGEVYMPLEFSVAAYRFGHTMVRGFYDYNRNFGRNKDGGRGVVIPFAPFELIFAFTGSARPEPFNGRGTTVLPFNWVIEWDRFVDKGDSLADHFARKIDTQLAPPLFDMINQITKDDEALPEAIQNILKRLAVRNLLRGYHLALPTGQAVASALGVTPLTEEQLQRGNSDAVNDALTDGDFLQATPLWFYILKEAEVRANGNSLGEVGSRIVVETIIGQLRADPDSYLNQDPVWSPEHGVLLPDDEPIVTIKDLFRFAGLLPTDLS
jgi:Animal haem peroxidase